MKQSNIRNIAIIAHVDHGKTTLVDQFFRQSGMFRDNEVVEERLMDSMDLEKERGITITSKNGSFIYKDFFINIIDTPGHADFGGQVERVLKMADGVLLLVDAAEGPMPQTRFVLKKALALKMPVIVVINKIDKPAARCEWVLDQIFDLFVKLDAPDDILDFPFIYTSAKAGYATFDYNIKNGTMIPLFDLIVDAVPPPVGNPNAPLQMLVSSLAYSPFLGRLAIGKITSGLFNINKEVIVSKADGSTMPARITKIYRFKGSGKEELETAGVGEIVAVAGMDAITVGETLTDPDNPMPLPGIEIDPPTISMNFIPNDSPFAGKEGKFLTSRHIRERLIRETLSDVALVLEELTDTVGYKVSGRGELHLSILIEKMRREGYEFQVTRPRVIFKESEQGKLEPYEELTIDVDEQYSGKVIENLGKRKGLMIEMHQHNGMVKMLYRIPTRGLIGFRSEFMTETKGMGTMSYIFDGYDRYAGEMRNRNNGGLVVMEECITVAYALFNLQERGQLFLGPGEKVYGGQIIGEHSRENDIVINPAKGKKLTNMRAAGSDDAVILTPFRKMSLEDCISYINEDELVEITPRSIRLRKTILDVTQRKRAKIADAKA
ncbi:MAG TPA: translational GTPase TypA [Syntrophorhabdaceae bacterium]|nr:translational GTPase TypA [Syntrophorhabdaceae bacterium]MDI9560748.1 translational GTPase TypA [Pseudomonadota bacterium]MBV6506553.1 GTP-binding protein TypA/BipA [Syntrophorhabdaceae bacterium]HOS60175.1 translational GTPase TypA [Syntrophorhabdaceae bacterium]HPH41235.1 translational GTPase TypA [Syntrophorhabdaceae bacterium]